MDFAKDGSQEGRLRRRAQLPAAYLAVCGVSALLLVVGVLSLGWSS